MIVVERLYNASLNIKVEYETKGVKCGLYF